MRAVVVLLAGLALTGGARAAPPAVSVTAAPGAGIAPLRVTLTATGDAAEYAWELGDGSAATGASVSHVYGDGRFLATVTATSATGETSQAQVAITVAPRTLALRAPLTADYRDVGVFSGTLAPAVRGARVQIYRGRTHVATARPDLRGRFRTRVLLRSPGPYHARYGVVRSPERTVRLRPQLEAAIPATAPVGAELTVRPRLVPAAGGEISIRIDGKPVAGPTVRLPTRTPRRLRIEIATRPRPGWAAVRRVVTAHVVLPSLARGARGPSVLALERRLAELRYVLRGVDSVYGQDTYEAVLAFQKVHGLPRTGRVEPWFWRRLAAANVPRPQRGGDYIEVDKSRQVLYDVHAGEVRKVVHVSTGATGNTPIGTWQVYRKVPGWDWVLWYPLYFLRGFAIHGYPSVPPYPASHGCVRIPMWLAPGIFASHGYDTTVVVRP